MKGFLGTDAPFMMDVVVVSLVVVVPLLIYSIRMAKAGAIVLHRKLQMTLAIVLGIAVVLFEVEMRLAGGIANIIPADRYTLMFRLYLWFHIFIAVMTLVFWSLTLVGANNHYKDEVMDPDYMSKHKKLGWASTLLLVATSVTGLGVYAWCFS